MVAVVNSPFSSDASLALALALTPRRYHPRAGTEHQGPAALPPAPAELRVACELLRPHLARAAHHIFVAGELFDTHWTTGVEAVGGNADLGAHTKLTTVGKLR